MKYKQQRKKKTGLFGKNKTLKIIKRVKLFLTMEYLIIK